MDQDESFKMEAPGKISAELPIACVSSNSDNPSASSYQQAIEVNPESIPSTRLRRLSGFH